MARLTAELPFSHLHTRGRFSFCRPHCLVARIVRDLSTVHVLCTCAVWRDSSSSLFPLLFLLFYFGCYSHYCLCRQSGSAQLPAPSLCPPVLSHSCTQSAAHSGAGCKVGHCLRLPAVSRPPGVCFSLSSCLRPWTRPPSSIRAPALPFPPSKAFHRAVFHSFAHLASAWLCSARPRLSRPAQLPLRWLLAETDAAR